MILVVFEEEPDRTVSVNIDDVNSLNDLKNLLKGKQKPSKKSKFDSLGVQGLIGVDVDA